MMVMRYVQMIVSSINTFESIESTRQSCISSVLVELVDKHTLVSCEVTSQNVSFVPPTIAELMMHNERVVRHCKGINQTLAELRVSFDKLLTEHQARFESLQQSVEAMESVVLRANKSSL